VKLTPEQINLAKILHRNGATALQIAAQFQCHGDTVLRIVDIEWRNRRNAQIREARAIRDTRRLGRRKHGAPPRPPSEVLADRDRSREAELTANMVVLGDPLPGRSALDRMGGGHA
jgi:hypothetical protein